MKKILKTVKDFFGILKSFFLRRGFLTVLIWLGVFLNLASVGVYIYLARSGQPLLILHYNAFLGIDLMIRFWQKSDYLKLFSPALIGIAIWLMNILTATALYQQTNMKDVIDKRVKVFDKHKSEMERVDKMNFLGARMLIVAGFLLQVFILIYSFSLILVNF